MAQDGRGGIQQLLRRAFVEIGGQLGRLRKGLDGDAFAGLGNWHDFCDV